MDISALIIGGQSAENSGESPAAIPTLSDSAVDSGPNESYSVMDDDDDSGDMNDFAAPDPGRPLTAVERIRAYRAGTMQPPGVGAAGNAADSADSAPVSSDTADSGPTDTAGAGPDASAPPTADQSADHGQADGDSDYDSDAGEGSRAHRFKVPRKALLIGAPVAAVLLIAGIAIPGRGDSHDSSTPVVAQSAAGGAVTPSPSTSRVVPDAVIHPAKVEAPEYPISVTPPTDALTGDKGKGWICAGMVGTVMTLTLPSPMVITEIDVMPGLDGSDIDGADLWAKHRIVTRVAFNLDYGDPVYGEFADRRELQPTTFRNAITQTIRLVVLETKDVSGKGPGAGGATTTPSAPGLLGDLGSLNLGPSNVIQPAANTGPATFAIGNIQILGHSPTY